MVDTTPEKPNTDLKKPVTTPDMLNTTKKWPAAALELFAGQSVIAQNALYKMQFTNQSPSKI